MSKLHKKHKENTYIEYWGLFGKTVPRLLCICFISLALSTLQAAQNPVSPVSKKNNSKKNHVDPWSKIVVTSNKAVCHKDKTPDKNFTFKYVDNVVVTLADDSTVKADELELIFDPKKKTEKKPEASSGSKNTFSQLKTLSFNKHVVFKSGRRKASADHVVIDVAKNTCTLDGHVKIWQAKGNKKDLPIAIESQKAVMHLRTFAVQLAGTSEHPVSTTIDLEGHPSVQQKSKARVKKA